MPLLPLFTNLFLEVYTQELYAKKIFQKMAPKITTPELSKALHPEQTEIENQIKRLKLVNLELKKNKIALKGASVSILHRPQTPIKDRALDLYFIVQSQQLLQAHIVNYRLLIQLAPEMELVHSIDLFNQSINDKKTTLTWLDNIAQRVISNEQIIVSA